MIDDEKPTKSINSNIQYSKMLQDYNFIQYF